MKNNPIGSIRVGIGGWTYAPWRGTFYPHGLPQKRELEYASRKLTAIEINSTYYASPEPESFAKWHDETPDGFVFAVKGPRFITNRRILAGAGESIERFFNSGVMTLKEKLGPINWQFMPTKKFDADDFEAFLKLLPTAIDGRRIRHAVEVRHASFATPVFIDLARRYAVAIVLAADSDYPQINDLTADFVYVRAMGTSESEPAGYSSVELAHWAARARLWASGQNADLATIQPFTASGPRDVFVFFIGGFKERNPAAGIELISKLEEC
jgi:uncharacterized protein YecE (DUF72 family)